MLHGISVSCIRCILEKILYAYRAKLAGGTTTRYIPCFRWSLFRSSSFRTAPTRGIGPKELTATKIHRETSPGIYESGPGFRALSSCLAEINRTNKTLPRPILKLRGRFLTYYVWYIQYKHWKRRQNDFAVRCLLFVLFSFFPRTENSTSEKNHAHLRRKREIQTR